MTAQAETKHTFCRICEAQCGLKVTVSSTSPHQIEQIAPDPEHVSSRGYACIKGLRMQDFVHSPDRITRPLKKIDGEFRPISWSQAIAEIGERLRDIHRRDGGEAIAAYMGNPIGFSFWPTSAMTFFLDAFGADKLFTPGTQDCANKFACGERMYGGADEQTFPDIDHTRCLIAVGSNPVISKMTFINMPHPMERIAAIEARGGKVYWVNPRRTESAKRCGEHVPIRPETDVFFMLAFLHEVLVRDAIDSTSVAATMRGLAEIREFAAPWTPEIVADVTRVPPSQLRRMVDDYLAADGAVIYSATGVNQTRFGLMTTWLQEVINAITGNLDRRGGALAGRGVFPKFERKGEQKYSRIGNVPYVNSTVPGGILADEILTPGKGRVRAMFNMAGNPLLSMSNSRRLAEAFADLELFVCLDIVRNETAEYADYILPGLHSLERADVPFYFFSMMGLMPTRWFDYTDPVLPPAGEARDEGLILRQIASAAGARFGGARIVEWVSRAGQFLSGVPLIGRVTSMDRLFLGMMIRSANIGSPAALRKAEHGTLLEPNQPGDYLGQRVRTADGKVQLAPVDLLARAGELQRHFQDERDKPATLKMISLRQRYSHNSWAHNATRFIKGDRNSNHLYINPDDAAERGLEEGTMATVSANGRSITVPVNLDDDMMRGAVSVPHGWGHQSAAGLSVARNTGGANVNELNPDGVASIEPLSGMSHMNGVRVEVTASARTPLSEVG